MVRDGSTLVPVTTSNAGLVTPNAYLYCGEQWDSDLGFYYLRARYLNPDSGRFWTMDEYEGDSADPLSLHKYLFTSNNPVNATDPTGRFTMVELLVVTGIGLAIAIPSASYIYNHTGDRAVMNKALENAKDVAKNAVLRLQLWGDKDRADFRTWFGTTSETTRDQVIGYFRQVERVLDGEFGRLRWTRMLKQPDDDPFVAAEVMPGNYHITVYPMFWNSPDTPASLPTEMTEDRTKWYSKPTTISTSPA